MGISYTDGKSEETRVIEAISDSSELGSEFCFPEVSQSWSLRYHLSPERSNLVRHLNLSGLEVLELGAGMGAVSRYFAEHASSLSVVEGTESRFQALESRLRDLSNWSGSVGNFQKVIPDRKFDVVTYIGVLEYSELYMTAESGKTVFDTALRLAKRHLKPGGVLIVAIENQLGIKYLNGCAEDHSGKLYDGISGYPLVPSAKTFSRKGLVELLKRNKFGEISQFFPFPDYKVPSSVLSLDFINEHPILAAEIAASRCFEHYGIAPLKYFPDYLSLRSFAEAGLLPEISNSFLFVASAKDSPIRQKVLSSFLKEGERAWHYASLRKIPTKTVFSFEEDGVVQVEKTSTTCNESQVKLGPEGDALIWHALPKTKASTGVSLRFPLNNHAYFGNWNEFETEFQSFISWSLDWWLQGDGQLSGKALDALYVNAYQKKSGKYVLFDLEWESETALSKSFFVFRNVYNLSRDENLFTSQAPFTSFAELYERTCRAVGISSPDTLSLCIDREAKIQALTGVNEDIEHHKNLLTGLFNREFPSEPLPRNAHLESEMRSELGRLQRENALFHELLGQTSMKVARKVHKVGSRVPLLQKWVGTPSSMAYQFLKKTKSSVDRYRSTQNVYHVGRAIHRGEWFRFQVSPAVGSIPEGFFSVEINGDLSGVSEIRLNLLYLDELKSRKSVVSPVAKSSESTASGFIKIGLEVEQAFVEFRGSLVKAPLIQFRELPWLQAAGKLLLPQIQEAFSSPDALVPMVKRGSDFTRAAGWPGFRTWVRQEGLQTHFSIVDRYTAWIQQYDVRSEGVREDQKKQSKAFTFQPLISVVMPTYNTDEKWLRRCLDSVRYQTYDNWELCIADDASPEPRVREVLKEYEALDPRIRVVYRNKNGHISEASNSALEIAKGEFVALLDHDDELSDQALFRMVEELNLHPDAVVLYSDEDKIDMHGRRSQPHFKPDWDPELMCSINLVTHFSMFRTATLKAIGGFRSAFDGSQDYDLTLRAVETASPNQIRHVPYVLYHWRAIPGSVALAPGEKHYAHERAREAIREHLTRRKIEGAEVVPCFGSLHRVKYPLPKSPPKVSVIIPTRDRLDLMVRVLDGLWNKTDYPNLEIIVVDNQSQEPETIERLTRWQDDGRIKLLSYSAPFNYSAINNYAVERASGEVLVFLNNDIEIVESDWLKELVSFALRSEVGAVGAKLLYPDLTVQHAGIVTGIHGVADHAERYLGKDHPGYFGRSQVIRSVSAASAACLVVRKEVFNEVGGFESENLKVAYNDVDLCLRIRAKGYRIVQNNCVNLIHHESVSRGSDQDAHHTHRFHQETNYMKEKWGRLLEEDPFFSPNLSLLSSDFRLAFPPLVATPKSDSTGKLKPSVGRETSLSS